MRDSAHITGLSLLVLHKTLFDEWMWAALNLQILRWAPHIGVDSTLGRSDTWLPGRGRRQYADEVGKRPAGAERKRVRTGEPVPRSVVFD